MKKLIVILLVVLFGVGAGTTDQPQKQGAEQTQSTTIKLTVDVNEIKALKQTAVNYYEYVQKNCEKEIAPAQYCKDKKAKNSKIQHTVNLKNTSEKTYAEDPNKFFTDMAGFYDELKEFKKDLDTIQSSVDIEKIEDLKLRIGMLKSNKETTDNIVSWFVGEQTGGKLGKYTFPDNFNKEFGEGFKFGTSVEKIEELIKNNKFDEAEKAIKEAEEAEEKRENTINKQLKKALDAVREEESILLEMPTPTSDPEKLNKKLKEDPYKGKVTLNDKEPVTETTDIKGQIEKTQQINQQIQSVKTEQSESLKGVVNGKLGKFKGLINQIATLTGQEPGTTINATINIINNILGKEPYTGTKKQDSHKEFDNVDTNNMDPKNLKELEKILDEEIKKAQGNITIINTKNTEIAANKAAKDAAAKLEEAKGNANAIFAALQTESTTLGGPTTPDLKDAKTPEDVDNAVKKYIIELNNKITVYNKEHHPSNADPNPATKLQKHNTDNPVKDTEATIATNNLEKIKADKAREEAEAAAKKAAEEEAKAAAEAEEEAKKAKVADLLAQIETERGKVDTVLAQEAKTINEYIAQFGEGKNLNVGPGSVLGLTPDDLGLEGDIPSNYKPYTDEEKAVVQNKPENDPAAKNDPDELAKILKKLEDVEAHSKRNKKAFSLAKAAKKLGENAKKKADEAKQKAVNDALMALATAKKTQAEQLALLGIPADELPDPNKINGNKNSENSLLNKAITKAGQQDGVTVPDARNNTITDIDPSKPETLTPENIKKLQDEVTNAQNIASALTTAAKEKAKNDANKDIETKQGEIKTVLGNLLGAKQTQADWIEKFGKEKPAITNGNEKSENDKLNKGLEEILSDYTKSNGSHKDGNENVLIFKPNSTVAVDVNNLPTDPNQLAKILEDLTDEYNKVNNTNSALDKLHNQRDTVKSYMEQLTICKENMTKKGKILLIEQNNLYQILPHQSDKGEAGYYSFLGAITDSNVVCPKITLYCDDCRNANGKTEYQLPNPKTEYDFNCIKNYSTVTEMGSEYAKGKKEICDQNNTELQNIIDACTTDGKTRIAEYNTIFEKIKNKSYATMTDIATACTNAKTAAKDAADKKAAEEKAAADKQKIATAQNKFDKAVEELLSAKQALASALNEYNETTGTPKAITISQGNSSTDNGKLKSGTDPDYNLDNIIATVSGATRQGQYDVFTKPSTVANAEKIDDTIRRMTEEAGKIRNDAANVGKAKEKRIATEKATKEEADRLLAEKKAAEEAEDKAKKEAAEKNNMADDDPSSFRNSLFECRKKMDQIEQTLGIYPTIKSQLPFGDNTNEEYYGSLGEIEDNNLCPKTKKYYDGSTTYDYKSPLYTPENSDYVINECLSTNVTRLRIMPASMAERKYEICKKNLDILGKISEACAGKEKFNKIKQDIKKAIYKHGKITDIINACNDEPAPANNATNADAAEEKRIAAEKATKEEADRLLAEEKAKSQAIIDYNTALGKLEGAKKLLAEQINKYNNNKNANANNVTKTMVENILGNGKANATYGSFTIPEDATSTDIRKLIEKINTETGNVEKDKDAIEPLASAQEIQNLKTELNNNLKDLCDVYKKSVTAKSRVVIDAVGSHTTYDPQFSQAEYEKIGNYTKIEDFSKKLASYCKKANTQITPSMKYTCELQVKKGSNSYKKSIDANAIIAGIILGETKRNKITPPRSINSCEMAKLLNPD